MQPSSVPELSATLGLNPEQAKLEAVSGGSIARSYRLSDGQNQSFIKCLDAAEGAILEAEQEGLNRLANTRTLAVPKVIGSGEIDQLAWLAIEWCEMHGMTAEADDLLGEQLAALHRNEGEYYGLEYNNFIGRTPQLNSPTENWTEFFFQHRLGFQLRLLDRNSPKHQWEQQLQGLRNQWEHQFPDYQPQASLLHGDLWSGNVALLQDGRPLVFDPAVHYGDRECDLAMADLFGGFSDRFYQSYNRSWPLARGWPQRRRYYQLYHLLNHANLFGGHYIEICRKLVAELADA